MNRIPLEPGETITATYRLSFLYLVRYVLLGGACVAGASLAIAMGIFSFGFFELGVFLLFVGAVILIVGWLTYRRSRLVITSLHVYDQLQATLFSENLRSLSLASITNAEGDRSGFLNTLFNAGKVSVQTMGGQVDYLSFQPVPAPEYVAVAINDAHEAYVNAHPLQSV